MSIFFGVSSRKLWKSAHHLVLCFEPAPQCYAWSLWLLDRYFGILQLPSAYLLLLNSFTYLCSFRAILSFITHLLVRCYYSSPGTSTTFQQKRLCAHPFPPFHNFVFLKLNIFVSNLACCDMSTRQSMGFIQNDAYMQIASRLRFSFFAYKHPYNAQNCIQVYIKRAHGTQNHAKYHSQLIPGAVSIFGCSTIN